MEELVKRLRAQAVYLPEKFSKNAELLDVLMKAADAIEELSKPRWIPVTERLPEVDQPVMICAFGKSVGEGVYRGHDGFHHVWKMYASSGTYWDDEVTHYMPLPQPPKEETK